MVQEADMIPVIEKHFQRLGYSTFTEVSVGGAGHGIADIVAVKINPEKVLQRIKNKQFKSIKTETQVELLKIITEEEKGTPISKIEKYFSFSKNHIKRNLIHELVQGNYVVETEEKTYKKINHIVPLASEVIAIEAKKEDWIGATQQARRYQSYANRVYVALLREYVHRVDKDRLRNNNVGLISVDMDKYLCAFEWKSRHKRPINNTTNFLAHEAVWERIRYNTEFFVY